MEQKATLTPETFCITASYVRCTQGQVLPEAKKQNQALVNETCLMQALRFKCILNILKIKALESNMERREPQALEKTNIEALNTNRKFKHSEVPPYGVLPDNENVRTLLEHWKEMKSKDIPCRQTSCSEVSANTRSLPSMAFGMFVHTFEEDHAKKRRVEALEHHFDSQALRLKCFRGCLDEWTVKTCKSTSRVEGLSPGSFKK